jgi:hypothetical protein
VSESRHLLEPEPPDPVVLVEGEVRGRPLPEADQPGAQEHPVVTASHSQATQTSRRLLGYPNAELLVQLSLERAQLRLAGLQVATGQVPHVREGAAVWTAMHEQGSTITNQRAADDPMHGRSEPRTSDRGRTPVGLVPWDRMLSMPTWTLSEIEAAVRSSWGPDTCFASAEYLARGSEQPSRGQCGTTALVIQDLLGGDLMVADVEYEGRVEGVHYWNLTPGGLELDLTRDQFTPGESLINQRRVTTGRNPSSAGEQHFQLLHGRVTAHLGS